MQRNRSLHTVMIGDQTVVAQFDIVPDLVTLRVDKSGPGNGMVRSDPGGIACLPTCVASLRGTQSSRSLPSPAELKV